MTPEEQVKTILSIFNDLSHNEQVDLFKEIRAGILSERKKRSESLVANRELVNSQIEMLEQGTKQIIAGLDN